LLPPTVTIRKKKFVEYRNSTHEQTTVRYASGPYKVIYKILQINLIYTLTQQLN